MHNPMKLDGEYGGRASQHICRVLRAEHGAGARQTSADGARNAAAFIRLNKDKEQRRMHTTTKIKSMIPKNISTQLSNQDTQD